MPRFTLAIIDNTRLLSHKVKGQCGVFITPQGYVDTHTPLTPPFCLYAHPPTQT